MKTLLALLASSVSVILQALRLRNRAAETENAAEDARDDAAARWRAALADGRPEDAIAARADHDALAAALKGAKPKNRKTTSPKK